MRRAIPAVRWPLERSERKSSDNTTRRSVGCDQRASRLQLAAEDRRAEIATRIAASGGVRGAIVDPELQRREVGAIRRQRGAVVAAPQDRVEIGDIKVGNGAAEKPADDVDRVAGRRKRRLDRAVGSRSPIRARTTRPR